jgi:hypothetical protein
MMLQIASHLVNMLSIFIWYKSIIASPKNSNTERSFWSACNCRWVSLENCFPLVKKMKSNKMYSSELLSFSLLLLSFAQQSFIYFIICLAIFSALFLNFCPGNFYCKESFFHWKKQSQFKTVLIRYHLLSTPVERQCHFLCRCAMEIIDNKSVVKHLTTICFRSGLNGYQVGEGDSDNLIN